MLIHFGRSYICSRCLLQARRNFSSKTPRFGGELLPSSGCARLKRRRLISLHGDDAPKFLQGLITTNVLPASQTPQPPFYSAFLSAQGKLLYDVFVFPTIGPRPQTRTGDDQWSAILGYNGEREPGYIIDVDAISSESLLTHLKRHKLRAKIRLRLLAEDEVEVWETWHDDLNRPTHERNDIGLVPEMLHAVDTRAFAPSLAPFGHRYLMPLRRSPDVRPFEGLFDYSGFYDTRRYLYGVPEGQIELPRDASFPHQSNIDIMGGIDFRKGCYVGQELTIRTQHTGVVRRRILPLMLYNMGGDEPQNLEYDLFGDGPYPPNEANITKVDSKGRSTGKWLGGSGNIGLGLCRLETMTDIAVSAEGTTRKEGDRFKVTWEAGKDMEGGEKAVKAFVPEWMRSRMREVKPARRLE
ncbi:MAG: mRNA-decapping enzyme subunit 2 [Bathelium mastoideum]|nr:MAG: mRNA-decapping enzyme subunit 2 [Bathelium mastoideum]